MSNENNIINNNALDRYTEDYTKYALYIVSSRVIPDIRDGLKPIHRRILYTGLAISKAYNNHYVKSADWYGATMGKFHPHGDSSIYGAMEGMANWFDINIPLIDGQGSWGTPQGNKAAAGRYTEACLSDFAYENVLAEIKEVPQVVDWVDSYTGRDKEPLALSPRVPLLLINGSFGIGVGIRQFVPSHNINEVIDETVALIDNPKHDVVLIPDQYMPCDIVDTDWKKISHSGYGKFRVRGRIEIIDSIPKELIPNKEYIGKPGLLITSTPNLVNLNSITEKLEKDIKEGKVKLPQILNILEPEPDKKKKKKSFENRFEEMKFVIVLKKGSDAAYVRDVLYKVTALETTFTINVQVLDDMEPKRISYKALLQSFIEYRKLTKFRYYANKRQKVRTKLHQKDAYIKALQSGKIDEIIKRIRKQKSTDEDANVEWLIKTLHITDFQAKFILNSPIKSLSEGYLNKYIEEANYLNNLDQLYLQKTLDEKLLEQEIKQELLEIKAKYGRPRNSKIISEAEVNNIPRGTFKVAISEKNMIKKVSINSDIGTFKDDKVAHYIVGENEKDLIIFDSIGKVYKLPIHKIPICEKSSHGLDIRTIVKKLTADIVGVFYEPDLNSVSNKTNHMNLIVQSKGGLIKKLDINDILGCPLSGIYYTKLSPGDLVTSVISSEEGSDVIVYSKNKALKYNNMEIPIQRRATKGVKSMNSDEVDGICTVSPNNRYLLVVTEKGILNKIEPVALPTSSRAKAGNRVIQLSRGDSIKYIYGVSDNDKLKIITNNGISELSIKDIPLGSTASKGNKIAEVNTNNPFIDCILTY